MTNITLGDVTVPPGTPTLPQLVDPPWYTTWWGLGLIGVGGYFGYTKFVKPKMKK